MTLEEVQERYGLYAAERVRQGLTLKEFADLEVEELVHHFELIAARAYETYQRCLEEPVPENAPALSREDYVGALRRRWQEAEELAHLVLACELSLEQDAVVGDA